MTERALDAASSAAPATLPSLDAPSLDLPAAVALRAVEWFIELQDGEADPACQRRWQQWLAAHDDHRRAWARIIEVNGRLRHRFDETLAALPEASELTQSTLERLPTRQAARRRALRHGALKLGACIAVAAAGALTAQRQLPWQQWLANWRTGVGEQRTIMLADGGRLMLNTDTAVDVDYSDQRRRLQLHRGEVLIETAADARPFEVLTGDGLLRPIGTRFLVRRREGGAGTEVTVLQGAVQLLPRQPAASVVVEAGQRASLRPDGVDAVTAAEPGAGTWVDGVISASGWRLADFLDELGRYRPGWLGCDPAVADLRISGTFPVADTDRALAALAAALPVRIRRRTAWWVRVEAQAPEKT